jgi:PhnB protein
MDLYLNGDNQIMSYIPKQNNHVSPYLGTDNPNEFVDFLINVFDAKEILKHEDEKYVHFEVKIVDTVIMIGKSTEDYPKLPTWLHVYVPDITMTYANALENGALSIREPNDQLDGVRGTIKDPEGHFWTMTTQKTD